MSKADNLTTHLYRVPRNSGCLNLLEPGPAQACKGIVIQRTALSLNESLKSCAVVILA